MTEYLLSSASHVGLLMIGGLAAAALIRRGSAALRHWVLSAALLSAACLPLLHAVAPRWDVARWVATRNSGQTHGPRLSTPAAASLSSFSTTVDLGSVPVAAGRQDPARTSLPRLLLVGWALGAGAALVLLGAGLGRLRWVAARARPLDHPLWARLAPDAARAAGLRRTVTLLHSDHPALLAAWGWRRPVVVVPRSATTWPPEDVAIVLGHEFAHIARGDWLLQLLAEIVRALNWFNPLVWIVARRLRAESERACDDAVLEQGVAGADYAERLVGLAKRLDTGRRWQFFPAPAMARPSSLERRVAAMLNDRLDRAPLTLSGRAVTLCLALAVALPVAGFAVFAQAPGTFTGSVLDPTGRPMEARLKLLHTASGINAEIRTGKIGTFQFSGLPPGEYAVEVSQPGFAMLKTTITMADAGVKRDFQLQLGSISEQLSVRASGGAPQPPSPPRNPPKAPSPRTTPCSADPSAGGNVLAPRKLKDVKPDYPASLAGQVTGDVVVAGVVGENGTVRDLRVVETPHPELGQSLMAAVSRWIFEPTLLNCEPVSVKITVKARFEQ